MKLFDISGKNAVVTGAYQGLGLALAQGLLEAGANVVLVDVNPAITEKAQELSSRAVGMACDLSNRDQRIELKSKIDELFDNRIDILVNNAGIQIRHPVLEFPIDDWDLVHEINLTASFDLAQWAAQRMVAQSSGKIINISSVNAIAAGVNTVAYCSAKGAVVQMTKTMSNELSALGVNVNCIAPGYLDTSMNEGIVHDEKRMEDIYLRIPAKRWGTGEDLVGTVIYLASSASDYVCGAVIPVDGGYLGR